MKHCKTCGGIDVRQTYYVRLNPNIDPYTQEAADILNQGDWDELTFCETCNEERDLEERDTDMPMLDVDLDKLQKLYDHAVENNLEVFKYDDQDILTSYAKYLIEYLKVQI